MKIEKTTTVKLTQHDIQDMLMHPFEVLGKVLARIALSRVK